MKLKNIQINSFFTIILLYIFLVITISSFLIGKRGMYNLFETQVEKYFSQSLSFSQSVLDEKVEDIVRFTKSTDIPSDLLTGDYETSLKKFLKRKIHDYIDFFIYVPQDKTQPIITEGIYLYDIAPLQNKIINKEIKFLESELIIIEQKSQSLVFIISSKKS